MSKKVMMQSIRMSLILFIYLASIACGTTPSILLESDFSSDNGKWSVEYGGTWKFVDGVYEGIERSSYAGDSNWTDYRISFIARCMNPEDDSQIWASFRYNDEWRRYAISVRGGQLNDILLLRYWETDGSKSDVSIGKSFPLGFKYQPKQWYKFRIEIQGGQIKVWVGDVNKPQVSYVDSDPIKSGAIALGGSWHLCQFDNVKLENLSEIALPELNRQEEQLCLEKAANDLKSRMAQRRASYKARQVVLDPENPRTVVSLNGDWLFMPEYQLSKDANAFDMSVQDLDWHTIDVPDFWNQIGWWLMTGAHGQADAFRYREMERTANYTFDSAKTNTAWYREWVKLPEQKTDKRLVIKFDASATISKVYFNGALIGSHVGMFAPFEFDVTDYAKWGQDNLLAVYVANAWTNTSKEVKTVAVTVAVTDEMLKSIPQGIYTAAYNTMGSIASQRVGGIWQPVTLSITPSVSIDDVFFQPRLNGAAVSITVKNASGDKFDGVVKIRINDSNTSQHITVDSNSQQVIQLSIKVDQPKLWSPEYPNLYKLETSLCQNDTVIDCVAQDVGFRTFEVQGTAFYLNGKPYWLRGANMPPHGLRPNDANLANTFLKLMHNGNQLATRTVCSPMSKTWCNAADQQGVAISLEGTWPWLMIRTSEIPDENLLRIWRQEMVDLVKSLRNHPSIIMWTIGNEQCFHEDPNYERRVKKWRIVSDMVKTIRELDPTRPIVMDSHYVRDYTKNPELLTYHFDDGDISDEHIYAGWYRPSVFSDEQYNGLYLPRHCAQPMISQEASTGYPNGDTGCSTRTYISRFVPQIWVGDDAYEHRNPAAFLAHNALVTKEWAEDVRRTRRTAGWIMFCNSCWFQNVDDPAHIKPYPVYDAFKTAMSDVLISLDHRNRHYFAGETIKGNVFVVNDDRDKRNLKKLRCELTLLYHNDVIARSEVSLPDCNYFENQSCPVEIRVPDKLPAVRGEYELKLDLYSKSDKIAYNSYTMLLASPKWSIPNLHSDRIIVLLGKTDTYKDYFGKVNLQTLGFNQAKLLDVN
ncbi:MAG: glycoside hydrolase family 2 TIM barrel-domain containing protein, partial [Phycisphaerae bacterium]